MKRSTTKLMIAAAALVVAAGSASAQVLQADIPFTFQVRGVVMAPGTYRVAVDQAAASRRVLIRNMDSHKSVMALAGDGDVSKDWKVRGTPSIRFLCAGARCTLQEMWTGYDGPALTFRTPKPEFNGESRIAEIVMTRVKAD